LRAGGALMPAGKAAIPAPKFRHSMGAELPEDAAVRGGSARRNGTPARRIKQLLAELGELPAEEPDDGIR